ncbi:hypothetical protein O0L34_g3386 [Tuta absoluta]|nr:hypothetical protein O0L34_g3386 [Tuta absoluta]
MAHRCSVFKHSCLKMPVDPVSKMPKTAYERKGKTLLEQSSIDSVSTTCSVSTADVDAEKLKDFYRSIPDYNDINHLPPEQFYSTLKSLREKKKVMLGIAIEHIEDCNHHKITIERSHFKNDETGPSAVKLKDSKPSLNHTLRRKYSAEKKDLDKAKLKERNSDLNNFTAKITGTALKRPSRKSTGNSDKYFNGDLKLTPSPDLTKSVKENIAPSNRPKRHPSACSISWNDAKTESKTEVDKKFDEFFDGRRYTSPSRLSIIDDFKTQSMPSSPLRMKRARSPTRRRKSITVPKPFKMTARDEDDRIVHELRSLQKSFSDDMLHQKQERHFRANPVPIESRIPLYDKILEDQAMRRAITKINSEAELRAQMKPFSFTKREEKGLGGNVCERALQALPKPKKKKRFKAKPFPKNLFSNYFYDKMREDDFFRNMNRRIRAEEMLKRANLPGSMATRDRSRLSTPAAHSDLPIDPSPAAGSSTSSDRQRCASPVKRRQNKGKEDFITTSPQPFKFYTADRAAKKMLDITRKIYQESRSSDSKLATPNEGPRAYSALELRSNSTGRSNLAALLRAEAVRRRFELEQASRQAEQRRRAELKTRDRLLRSKPSWHLVKNNHAEDIALRLQTRRDEERMRREEFLHEMELMYGRVQQQPMMFERYYGPPRSYSDPMDSIQLSPKKTKKRNSKKSYNSSPMRSRKVSINDTPEPFNAGGVAEYLNEISDSEVPTDSGR